MDCENKKRKYFDKLKKSSLLELRKKNIGGLVNLFLNYNLKLKYNFFIKLKNKNKCIKVFFKISSALILLNIYLENFIYSQQFTVKQHFF